ncbi:gp436 family protein [Thermomonas sp.]|uniref:gp436 family protein n=1 Tax=Thermomonas sp. TaxID=1971895 RepID=UPI0035B1D96D
MYCTPTLLADAKLTRELAQAATPERMPIPSDEAMDAVLRGTSTVGMDADEIEAAEAALVVVNNALQAASELIDGYLVMRKPTPYTVPLSPVPGIVVTWCRWIARYLLHKDRVNTQEATDPVVRDYKEALRFLAMLRDGEFSLGADDPLPAPSSGMPQHCGPARVFTTDTLKDFGL